MATNKDNTIKKLFKYLWDYTDSYLDNWVKKIFFALMFFTTQFLAAYITAVFDVGLMERDVSIRGMLREYQMPGMKFPFDVFLVLSLVIDFLAVLIIWKHGTPPGGRNFKLSKSNTYGSGREISKRELAGVTELKNKDSVLGTILGQLDDTGKQVLAAKSGSMPNDNMLVFGPPGSGKSTSYVLTYIAQAILRRHSVCVSDTKGEVYAKTAELARRHGYRVLRLDLKDPEHSDGWHVLKELRHDDMRALIFAKTVMANTNSDGGKDIHAAPEESLLKACCLYQERHPKLDPAQRTFYNAFAMLLNSAETLDASFMAAASEHGNCMQIVMDSYATFLQGSPNLRGNIITGLANRLQVLASPPVKEMTSTDEIDFTSMGKEPTILYISMSDQHQTMSFLASLAFSFAFLDLVDLADHSPGQRLKVPVHFLMEEFGNLGYIPNIDKYLSTARSRGISINLVIQSLAQLESVYEESMTDIILADCATWMCLGCNDKSTAELLEWRSGEATIQVQTTQHDAMEPPFRLSHRNSTGDGRRSFYTSNDIMKIRARQEAFIVWQQLDSLKCRAFPIFQHREFQAGHMPEITAASLIPLSNKKAKQIFRAWEEERIRSFRAWMAAGGDPLKDYKMGSKKEGPAAGTDLPDVVPIHSLERMALAEAAGEVYDPTSDPDNKQYLPPKEDDDVVAEEPLDLTGWVFEKEIPASAAKVANSNISNGQPKRQTYKPVPEEERPVTTADIDIAHEAAEENAAKKAAEEEALRKQEETRVEQETQADPSEEQTGREEAQPEPNEENSAKKASEEERRKMEAFRKKEEARMEQEAQAEAAAKKAKEETKKEKRATHKDKPEQDAPAVDPVLQLMEDRAKKANAEPEPKSSQKALTEEEKRLQAQQKELQKRADNQAKKKQQEQEATQIFFNNNAQQIPTLKKSPKDKKNTKLDGGHQKLPGREESTPPATEGSDTNV